DPHSPYETLTNTASAAPTCGTTIWATPLMTLTLIEVLVSGAVVAALLAAMRLNVTRTIDADAGHATFTLMSRAAGCEVGNCVHQELTVGAHPAVEPTSRLRLGVPFAVVCHDGSALSEESDDTLVER